MPRLHRRTLVDEVHLDIKICSIKSYQSCWSHVGCAEGGYIVLSIGGCSRTEGNSQGRSNAATKKIAEGPEVVEDCGRYIESTCTKSFMSKV